MMTVPHVVESVYGTAAQCAAALGVQPSAVSNWKTFGQFPARLAATIVRHARENGVELDVADLPVSEQVRRPENNGAPA